MMSKPAVIRHENVIDMISEIHESMTNVVTSGAYTVAGIIMDSIHEDAIWVGTQSDVTFSEIQTIVQTWIDDETAVQVEAPAITEVEVPATYTIKVIGVGMKQVKAADVRSAIIKAVTKSRAKHGVEYDASTQVYTVTKRCGNARKVVGKVTVW
jgi:hypothetical protein